MRDAGENAREAARRWARDLLGRPDWVVLDTETTGLDGRAEVVQIGIVAPDGTTLLDTLVRPTCRIPRDVIAIHGITDAMVVDAPTFGDVLLVLEPLLIDKTVVSYNAAFDERMLRQSSLLNKARALSLRWECAMEQYARFVGQRSYRHGHYVWQKLPRRPGSPQEKHQAVGDCLAALDVIRLMAEEPDRLAPEYPWRTRRQ